MNPIQELLQETTPILLDGAMGTMLMRAGLEAGYSPELWNVENPEAIRGVYRAYIQAGARIVLSNTFGGNAFRLGLHNAADRVTELVTAGAHNLRLEVDAVPHKVVAAGSMGPTGEVLLPYGEADIDDVRAAFVEQAKALADGGVEVICIETMSDLNELKAAIEAIRSVTDLPITATMTFDTNGFTMMGTSPEKMLEEVAPYELAAVGGNCGNGPAEIEGVIQKMRAVDPDLTLIAKSNAGIPKYVDGEIVYDATPEVMAKHAVHVHELGANLIGGCCGNTPNHIQAMAEALGVSSP